jgi:integrase
LKQSLKQKKKYKEAYLYDAKGDLSKRWFVRFALLDPITNKYKYLREYIPAAFSTLKERYSAAKEIIETLNELLYSEKLTFESYYQVKEDQEYPIDRLIDNYIKLILPSKSERSIQSYRASVLKFKNWCIINGIKDFKRTSTSVFSKYLNENYGHQNSKTFNKHLSILSSVCHDLENDIEYKIKINHFQNIKRKKELHKDPIIWPKQDLLKYFNWTKQNDLSLYILSLCVFQTFIRPSELLRLKCGTYYPTKGVLFIGKLDAKTDSSDYVTLTHELTNLINNRIANFPDDYYIFGDKFNVSIKKWHPNRVFERFSEVKSKLQLNSKCTLYRLKHTGNTILSESGADIDFIRQKNRHANKVMTENYIKVLHVKVDERAKNFPDFKNLEF